MQYSTRGSTTTEFSVRSSPISLFLFLYSEGIDCLKCYFVVVMSGTVIPSATLSFNPFSRTMYWMFGSHKPIVVYVLRIHVFALQSTLT